MTDLPPPPPHRHALLLRDMSSPHCTPSSLAPTSCLQHGCNGMLLPGNTCIERRHRNVNCCLFTDLLISGVWLVKLEQSAEQCQVLY